MELPEFDPDCDLRVLTGRRQAEAIATGSMLALLQTLTLFYGQ